MRQYGRAALDTPPFPMEPERTGHPGCALHLLRPGGAVAVADVAILREGPSDIRARTGRGGGWAFVQSRGDRPCEDTVAGVVDGEQVIGCKHTERDLVVGRSRSIPGEAHVSGVQRREALADEEADMRAGRGVRLKDGHWRTESTY